MLNEIVRFFEIVVLGESPSNEEDSPDDWALYLETTERAEVKRLLEKLGDAGIDFFRETETKPIWEPFPRSDERVYVRKGDVADAKKTLGSGGESEDPDGSENREGK